MGSASFPMAYVGISGVEPSASIRTVLLFNELQFGVG
jgi:hypothetical protein